MKMPLMLIKYRMLRQPNKRLSKCSHHFLQFTNELEYHVILKKHNNYMIQTHNKTKMIKLPHYYKFCSSLKLLYCE